MKTPDLPTHDALPLLLQMRHAHQTSGIADAATRLDRLNRLGETVLRPRHRRV